MNNLRTDAPTSRRIVRAFVDFLDSVEPAPGVDLEGLEVVKDCLTEVFGLNRLSTYDLPQHDLLLNLFSAHENDRQSGHVTSNAEAAPSKPEEDSTCTGSGTTSSPQENNDTRDFSNIEVSKDELFGQFFAALESVHYFRPTADADDDQEQLERVTSLFHDAVNEMECAGCKHLNRRSLADALKTLGNKAMQSTLYSDAIERYTCAIALGGNDAVYYCNRAAAYTQLGKYDEAIRDCHKSIGIDPSYSKAYSRLGLVYYAQGKYGEALHKGFMKALMLDPNNDAVKENIRAAQQKLSEDHQHRRQNQGPAPSPFSVTVDASSLPPNVASMFMNMPMNHRPYEQGQSSSGNVPSGPNLFGGGGPNPADLASMISNLVSTVQQQHQQQSPSSQHQSTTEENRWGGENGSYHGPDAPEISIDSDMMFDLNGNQIQTSVEEELETFRSMMDNMFSGSGASQGGTMAWAGSGNDNVNGNGDGDGDGDGNVNDNENSTSS